MESLSATAAALAAPASSAAERAAAERVFLGLKEVGFAGFRDVLDQSDDELVLFHTATVLKQAVIEQIRGVASADIAEDVRVYLLQYTLTRPQLYRSVKEQLLASAAILLKRGWVDSAEVASDVFGAEMEQLTMGDLAQRTTLLSYLLAVLNEFASNARSNATGFTLEVHMAAKRSLEQMQLRQIFAAACGGFGEIALGPSIVRHRPLVEQLDQLAFGFVHASLLVMDFVLSWQFSTHRTRRMIGAFKAETSTLFRGDPDWQAVLTPQLVQGLCSVYPLVRSTVGCAHPVRQCLVQLSTTSTVYPDQATAVAFVANLAQGFINIITGTAEVSVEPEEMLAWCTVLVNLMRAFGFDTIVMCCGAAGAQQLLDAAQFLIASILRHMVAGGVDDGGEDGEGCTSEAVNAAFEAWGMIVRASQFVATPVWHDRAGLPFAQYLEARMAKAARDALDDAEVQEELAPDQELYEVQLQSVAGIGRLQAASAVSTVGTTLQAKIASLSTLLDADVVDGAALAVTSEELHWALLLTGFLFTDSECGDRDFVPADIMALSAHAEVVEADIVVQVSTTVLGLLSSIAAIADGGCADRISPVIAGDVAWWLCRWVRAYLLIREERYTSTLETSLSGTLIEAFGQDSPGAADAAEMLMSGVCSILLVWQGDPTVVRQCVALMDALSERRVTQRQLLKGRVAWQLAEGFRDAVSNVGRLPAELQTHVAKVLCRLCSAASSGDRKRLFEHIMEPTHCNFMAVLGRPDFGSAIAQSPDVQTCVHRTVYVLRGVAQAVSENTVELYFGYFHDMLEALVILFSVYANVPETCGLVMELLIDLMRHVASRLSAMHQSALFTAVAAVVRTHSPNVARLAGGASEQQQAEFTDHILLLVQILSAASTAQQFSGETTGGAATGVTTAADVAMEGLALLLPMFTGNILSVPELCSSYFSLVGFLAQEHSGQLYASPETCALIIRTIEHAMGPYGSEITRASLDALHNIGSTHYERLRHGIGVAELEGPLSTLLEKVFTMFILEPFDLQLEQSAARALFPLICIGPDQFQRLVDALLHQQPDPVLQQRLLDAFAGLVTNGGLQLVPNRKEQSTFIGNFKELLGAVRGFILKH